jgi:hypothetical protein
LSCRIINTQDNKDFQCLLIQDKKPPGVQKSELETYEKYRKLLKKFNDRDLRKRTLPTVCRIFVNENTHESLIWLQLLHGAYCWGYFDKGEEAEVLNAVKASLHQIPFLPEQKEKLNEKVNSLLDNLMITIPYPYDELSFASLKKKLEKAERYANRKEGIFYPNSVLDIANSTGIPRSTLYWLIDNKGIDWTDSSGRKILPRSGREQLKVEIEKRKLKERRIKIRNELIKFGMKPDTAIKKLYRCKNPSDTMVANWKARLILSHSGSSSPSSHFSSSNSASRAS